MLSALARREGRLLLTRADLKHEGGQQANASAEQGELHLSTPARLPSPAACAGHPSHRKQLLAASLALPAQPAWGRGVRSSRWADP